MEALIQKLDHHKGVLLTSSYEFPGRYSRWSLGFADPPLELSGRASHAKIRALNERGRLLLPAIITAMQQLQDEGILESVHVIHDHEAGKESSLMPVQVDVQVVPPSEVGTFSEEERSRQVWQLQKKETIECFLCLLTPSHFSFTTHR
jgi:anthranilate synthase